MAADDEEAIPRFTDQEEELAFWRTRAQNLRSTLRDTEMTLKEFEESSRELEKEMESELNASNTKARDLQVRAEKLKGDVDEWKGKYQRALTDHNKTLAELNRELSMLRESHNVYKNKLRDMELDNDELENAERMVASSLTDMETRYNRAIERTALLEEELVAKTKLEEENQRLKDELQEVKEELAVWQERYSASRPNTRASVDLAAGSGRGSIDVDRASQFRPSSRAGHDRPSSRAGGVYSPLQPGGSSSSSSSAAAAARRSVLQHRPSLAAHARRDSADVRIYGSSNVESMSSSPTTGNFKARQSIGLGRSTGPGTRSSRPPFASGRVQQGASMRKMAGLLNNLRELQATVHSATRIGPYDGHASAIPRPASRLSSSIGPSSSTPRRSLDVRRDEQGTPSAIPVPAHGLSRSTSQRPPSRLAMPSGTHRQPSSVRSQTPNLEHYSSLDFLDQDPAQQQQQLRRRSHIALTSTNVNSLASSTSQASGLSRPRGSTISSNVLRRGDDPLRKTVHPRTGKPAPPPVSLRQTISRPRSSSVGSNPG